MNGPGSGETILLNRIVNWGRHSLPRWVRNWCHTGVTCSTFSFFMLPSQLCSFHIHLQYATSISLAGARLGKISESFILELNLSLQNSNFGTQLLHTLEFCFLEK